MQIRLEDAVYKREEKRKVIEWSDVTQYMEPYTIMLPSFMNSHEDETAIQLPSLTPCHEYSTGSSAFYHGKPYYPLYDMHSSMNEMILPKLDVTSDDEVIHREHSGDEHELKDLKFGGDEKSTSKIRSRRQRAKHMIVPMEVIVEKEKVPGLFIDVTEDEFDEMVYDNETALAFAARVGLIQNLRRCPKCQREMALCKFNNSCGYRWVCRRTEQGRRFTCSVRGMRKDTVLDDRLVGILTMLRIMFHFSQCVPDSEIINKLDIGHVRSARTILSRLREMVDAEVCQFDNTKNMSRECLRDHFFESTEIDHFGFLLYWGTNYTPPEKHNDGDDNDSEDAIDENMAPVEFD